MQSIFAAALGFGLALFLVLLIAPFIARRISALTWGNALRVLPQSSEEIAAARDHLRGIHAMDMRKLEMKLEKTSDTLSQLRIERVGFEDQIAEKKAVGEKLADELGQVSAALLDSQGKAAQAQEELTLIRTELAAKSLAINALEDANEASSKELAKSAAALKGETERVQAAEKRLETLRSDLLQMRARFTQFEGEARTSRSEAKRLDQDLRLATRKITTLEARNERLTAQLAEAEERATRREAEFKRLKDARGTGPNISAVAQANVKPTSAPRADVAASISKPSPAIDASAEGAVAIAKAKDTRPATEPLSEKVTPARTALSEKQLILQQLEALKPALIAAPNGSQRDLANTKSAMMDIAARVVVHEAAKRPDLAKQLDTLPSSGSELALAIKRAKS
jgi:chromosome segregation ATPase